MTRPKKKEIKEVTVTSDKWNEIPDVVKHDSFDADGIKEGWADHVAINVIKKTMVKIIKAVNSIESTLVDIEDELHFVSPQCSDIALMIRSECAEIEHYANYQMPTAIKEAYSEEVCAEEEINPEQLYLEKIEQKKREIKALEELLEVIKAD